MKEDLERRVKVLDFKKDYSSFQEGAKRFEAAMAGIPDRVPVAK